MLQDQIKIIAENLPTHLGGVSLSAPSINLDGNKKITFPIDRQLGAFIHIYKNPAIGWHAAALYASAGKKFPVPLRGEDHWVFKAYLYCKNPALYNNRHLLEAIFLAHPEMKSMRDIIESLLLTNDYDSPEKISKATGIHKNTISAYEKLFFNVLDRKKDLMYLRNIVYPDSRLIEMFDGYANAEDFGMLLKRYGYNHNGSELLYLSGLPMDEVDPMPSATAASKLEGSLMTQGFMLTKLGFVNQTRHTQAIHHARSVIAAAKQGGQTDTADAAPMSSVSELLYETFKSEGRAAAFIMDANLVAEQTASVSVVNV